MQTSLLTALHAGAHSSASTIGTTRVVIGTRTTVPLLLLAGGFPVTGCTASTGMTGFGSGSRFRGVLAAFMTGPGGGGVRAVVRTEDSGFRVGLADPGNFVTATRVEADFVGWMSVGMTRVRTTVVVIELKISVVVVIVVEPSAVSLAIGVLTGSAAVPRIVREPMIVETNVFGGITVVRTEVMVRGLSLV